MRLRALRKLEEFEIRKEFEKLSEEKEGIVELLGSTEKQWEVISDQVREIKKEFNKDTEMGKRRTTFETAPEANLDDIQTAMIEREPITVIMSEKGWIRALKGHTTDLSAVPFKAGDKLKHWAHAQTTDKLLMLSTNGRIYTILGDKLPGGRGHGEPVRILVDMDEGTDIVDLVVYQPGAKRLIASDLGNGFIVPEDGLIANTRKGKQVLNVSGQAEAKIFTPVTGDMVAVIGQNRKLLVFPLDQMPEMGRGRACVCNAIKMAASRM